MYSSKRNSPRCSSRIQSDTFPQRRLDRLALARNIPFHSPCKLNMMLFKRVAHVGYLPDRRILGLSKLPRVLEPFSRRRQVQEWLTKQVADWLDDQIDPQDGGVVLGTNICA